MLGESLSYPTDDEDWVEPFLIGSGLIFASMIFNPVGILLNGYYLRVFRAAFTDSDTLPPFDDWVDMAVDGLKLLVVMIVYTGVPSMLLFGTMFAAFVIVGLSTGSDSTVIFAIFAVLGFAVVLVVTLVWLLGMVLAPAAIGHMVSEDGLEAAFHVRDLVSIARQRDYLVALGWAFTVGFVITMIGGLFVVLLIGIPVVFYGTVVTYHLLGRGYREGRQSAGLAEVAAESAGS